jgi:DNA-binding NtrC family response regulator
MQRAVALTPAGVIRVEDLPPDLSRTGESATKAPAPTDIPLMSLRELEHAGIRRALHETKGDRRQAAELLGITPRMLNSKLADHRLS